MSSAPLPSVISCVEAVSMPMDTLDPFLFCVYHKDLYPADKSGKMEAPRRGNGADFNPSADYRMYHGDMVPGFPGHPHRGFETVTATIEGHIDHADSHGNSGRYGMGDLQWMTAGKGVQHSEMFPLVHEDKPNINRFFQIWLNLPAASKFSKPAFVMQWAEEVPKVIADEGRAVATVWAGELMGKTALPPPPDSFANDPANDVAIWLITLAPGGTLTLPPARSGETNRAVYFVEGTEVTMAGATIRQSPTKRVVLRAELECEVVNTGDITADLLILQGRPIGEPVAQHGPFVMNTREEIQQAFSDYRRTQFGGWPWDSDGPVFDRDAGRFAELYGDKTVPPPAGDSEGKLA